MSRLYSPQAILELGTELFVASGARTEEAHAAVSALVTSSLMGHDSHGVIRIPEYLGFVADGSLKTNAQILFEQTGPGTGVVDCGYGFGAVGATRAIREAVAMAKVQRTACVITRNCNHVGRLGAWVQLAAEQGMLALATCNSPISGHFVLPWGGRQPRLATNPIAYAVPTTGDPVLSDFSTSVAPEGKVRYYRNQGLPVPEGWILDHEGNPVTDPNLFYGPPRGGILPLGGAAGHKGFALGFLVEILGSALAGLGSQDPTVRGNGTCFVVIDPSAFCPIEVFRRQVDDSVAYMKSSLPAPGFSEVLVPGELEFRTMRQRQRSGIPIDQATRQGLIDWCQRLNLSARQVLSE